jgi:GTP-binding protein HflX
MNEERSSNKTDFNSGRLSDLKKDEKALLVGIYLSSKEKEDCNEHLDELASLCDTYGVDVDQRLPCPLRKFDSASFLGKGKVEEIAKICEERKISIVIFDEEIAPHQQRNLEKAFKNIVIDRTELILGVFEKRAKTREAKIQVEVAQLRYQMPRLRRMWTHLSRQKVGGGGKGGHLKGEGEKQIEIDRLLVRKRVSRLQQELKQIKKQRDIQRVARKRNAVPSFAIIGYTNAGKSTLLNALTKAKAFVEDKLFATLDTTTRKFSLPNGQEILLIDTVGFIRKIPHTLIAAFKSTLEEAVEADILIHLVDVSRSGSENRIKSTEEVLKELKAEENPKILCFNKMDICTDKSEAMRLRLLFPKTIEISALEKTGFDELTEIMINQIALLRKRIKVKIPQSHYSLASELMREGRVISCEYVDNDIILDIEISKNLEKSVEAYLI